MIPWWKLNRPPIEGIDLELLCMFVQGIPPREMAKRCGRDIHVTAALLKRALRREGIPRDADAREKARLALIASAERDPIFQ